MPPHLAAPDQTGSCATARGAAPSTASTSSPGRTPARSAGPPGVTSATTHSGNRASRPDCAGVTWRSRARATAGVVKKLCASCWRSTSTTASMAGYVSAIVRASHTCSLARASSGSQSMRSPTTACSRMNPRARSRYRDGSLRRPSQPAVEPVFGVVGLPRVPGVAPDWAELRGRAPALSTTWLRRARTGCSAAAAVRIGPLERQVDVVQGEPLT